MSRRCPLCDKKSITRTTWKKVRSKYNPVNVKRKYPNLQWVTIADGKRIKACAKCIKAMSKPLKKDK